MSSESGARLTFEPGEVISDRYRMVRKLGSGGMGTVFEAFDQVLVRPVAFKTVSGVGLTPEDLVRFQREARVASNIDHPCVIQMLDFGILESTIPFMVMELVDGTTIDELIEKGPLAVDYALKVIEKICDGMAAVHKAEIVHRDLKSSNIMVIDQQSGEPAVKILDFGIAKSLGVDRDKGDITRTGQIFGSPMYMSPEQARGKELDQRSDVYSLGCIAFELLTGSSLFVAETAIEVINKHTFEQPPLVSERRADLSEALDGLVMRAVSKDPAERFQSMDEMKVYVQELRNAPTGESKEDRVERTSRRALYAFVAATALVLALAGLFGRTLIEQLLPVVRPVRAVSKAKSTGIEDILDQAPDLLLEGGFLVTDERHVAKELQELIKAHKPVSTVLMKRAQLTVEDARLINKLHPHSLKLGGSELSDAVLEELCKNRKLRSLELDTCKNLSPHAFEAIAATRVSLLFVRDCNLTDEHLKALGDSRTLRQVVLIGNQLVSAEGLSALARKHPPQVVFAGKTAVASLSQRKIKLLESRLKMRINVKYEGSDEYRQYVQDLPF